MKSAILRQPNPIGTAIAWFWSFDGNAKCAVLFLDPKGVVIA
jgi:hypothetical protein